MGIDIHEIEHLIEPDRNALLFKKKGTIYNCEPKQSKIVSNQVKTAYNKEFE